MRYIKYSIPVFMLLITITAAAQQEDCAVSLREAEQLYDAGRIENIPQMLQSCIDRGFTQEEKLSAYKLIILCHIYNDDVDRANEDMLAFLKKYPEYELTGTDPDEFRFIFEQYRTRPVLDIGPMIGVNRSHGMISQPFSPFNLNQLKPKYTSDGFSVHLGAMFNFYLGNRFQLSLEPMYAQSKFQLEYDKPPIPAEALPNGLDHFERQDFLYIPLSGIYEFDAGQIRPYVRLGFQLGYLFTNTTATTQGIFAGPDEDNLENRNQLNYWAFLGAGAKYKLNKSYFFLDLRYNFGLNQYLISPDKRFTQENHNWVYMYQDSDFRLNTLMLSFGYARSLYNPKKVK